MTARLTDEDLRAIRAEHERSSWVLGFEGPRLLDALEAERADASRVCDRLGCTAAVIRRDDGSRWCAAGHGCRWVDASELQAERARIAELEVAAARHREAIDGLTAATAKLTAELRAQAEAWIADQGRHADEVRGLRDALVTFGAHLDNCNNDPDDVGASDGCCCGLSDWLS
jgi:hypothetical protein